jgi:3-oxoacyl-(acyl-carrier-protein) synthase III
MPAIPPNVRGAVITGWGTALPPKVVTNHDLEQTIDTSHDWIVERTGIHERRVGGSTVGLSVESGRAALAMSGVDPLSIDALVLATTTPDRTVPASSATVQHELGLRCGAYDVNAACSGFVYALVQAHGMIAMGAKKVLVIGTDTLARITDWSDRNTAILFADGSAAVVLEAVDGPGQLLGWDLDADGSAEKYLYSDIGGFIQMDGKEVFRRAVRIMVDSATKSMNHAGVTVRRHRAGHSAPGQHPHHPGLHGPPRPPHREGRCRAAPHRQHVVRVHPARPRRRPGQRPDLQRRPRAPRRLRRRHDRGQRHPALGRHHRRRHRAHGAGMSRVVLVTGGSRGIGLACAQRFAELGDRVAVTYNSSPPPDGFFGVQCDVTSTESVDAAFAAVEAEFGPVEVLVSNAGVTNDGLLLRMSEGDFTSVIDANLTAAFRVTKRASQGMLRARKGRIILMSSVVALLGSAGQANYAASKAGLVGFARSVARELGSRSITCNVVAPGPVATDMTAALSEKRLAELTAAVPLGRVATPEEIAGVVAFLASPDAAYITGAVIPVDGGLGMGH